MIFLTCMLLTPANAADVGAVASAVSALYYIFSSMYDWLMNGRSLGWLWDGGSGTGVSDSMSALKATAMELAKHKIDPDESKGPFFAFLKPHTHTHNSHPPIALVELTSMLVILSR